MSELNGKPKWTPAELGSDAVTKKDLISYLQETGSNEFLLEHRLNGKLTNIAKTAKKPALIAAYSNLFETKRFRSADEVSASKVKQQKTEVTDESKTQEVKSTVVEAPKYTKKTTKKGSGGRCPKKGDRVRVFYTGTLENGTVFDTNTKPKGRKPPSPLVFKAGTGKVIRGWDEALMTMCQGEKATLTIQPEWAYGQRGMAGAGIPPNATLIFDVELVEIVD